MYDFGFELCSVLFALYYSPYEILNLDIDFKVRIGVKNLTTSAGTKK